MHLSISLSTFEPFHYPSLFHVWYRHVSLIHSEKGPVFGDVGSAVRHSDVRIPVDSWPLVKNLSNELGIRQRHSRSLMSQGSSLHGWPHVAWIYRCPKPHGRHFRGFEAGSDRMEAPQPLARLRGGAEVITW
jgi:hypothetical protein